MQFKVGYYLFAILFLMFDVETVNRTGHNNHIRLTGTRPRHFKPETGKVITRRPEGAEVFG